MLKFVELTTPAELGPVTVSGVVPEGVTGRKVARVLR